MSAQAPIRRITAPQIRARKGGEPIVSLTSYHAHTAAIVDKYADFILVGDSLGMVMHGMDSTIGVPLDLMIMHGKAVVRGTQAALIVVDMPFGTYEESPQMAFRNAAKIMKETACGGRQAGRRRAHGRHHPLSVGTRDSGHGAYRADAAIGEHDGRLQGAGAGMKPLGPRISTTPKRSQRQALLRWSSKAWSRNWPTASQRRWIFRPSALAHRKIAMGRYWCWRTCWA